jgi:hypothetical protein
MSAQSSLGAPQATPSPACGGGSGRGRVPLPPAPTFEMGKKKSGALETVVVALGGSSSPLPDHPPQAGEGTP